MEKDDLLYSVDPFYEDKELEAKSDADFKETMFKVKTGIIKLEGIKYSDSNNDDGILDTDPDDYMFE